MRSRIAIRLLAVLACAWISCSVVGQRPLARGVTMVAPPEEIGERPFRELAAAGADHVALVPYGMGRIDEPTLRYDMQWQWWGERPDGLRRCVQLAHDQGLQVLLKPQVYIHGSWVGDVDYDTEEEWQQWEQAYRDYIMTFVEIAIEESVEMFCIGTEYKIAVKKREAFWRDLIREVRSRYTGKVLYSSNWDAYEEVPFWDDLDYIGVSAYFPLSDYATPPVNLLVKKWRPIRKKLERFSKKRDKQVVFTEYGYLTVDGCAGEAWNLEKGVQSRTINHTAQANAYQALYQTYWNEDWWGGGFLWKWFPDGMGHEGYPERDYTPQDKPAMEVVKKWFTR